MTDLDRTLAWLESQLEYMPSRAQLDCTCKHCTLFNIGTQLIAVARAAHEWRLSCDYAAESAEPYKERWPWQWGSDVNNALDALAALGPATPKE